MSHIVASEVVVDFPIYDTAHRSLKKKLIRATTGGRIARDSGDRITVRALDRVTFEIRPGDRVGLAGHNGAGKTTLLRVLAGIYEPLSGSLEVEGRVATLLELFLGLDVDSTGYENIVLRGLYMGLSHREIRQRAEEIAEFTELGDYLAMPVRTYSSGMKLRLAFAVSTSVNADILLMDEWLSVGDSDFRPKARRRMEELMARSSILVFASQDRSMMAELCNRVFWLEHGRISELPPETQSNP
jgi:lipopolysaccharide transport system ATP-binding protein